MSLATHFITTSLLRSCYFRPHFILRDGLATLPSSMSPIASSWIVIANDELKFENHKVFDAVSYSSFASHRFHDYMTERPYYLL